MRVAKKAKVCSGIEFLTRQLYTYFQDGLKNKNWSGKNHDSVEIMLVAFPANEDKTNFTTNVNRNGRKYKSDVVLQNIEMEEKRTQPV